jgi:transposase
MWIIESCFRKMKTTGLAIRPMFHYMPQRITAHVKLCVLALMIQRAAELATSLPWNRLHDILTPLRAVKYQSEGKTILQASKIRPDATDIFKKLDISKPKTILAVD